MKASGGPVGVSTIDAGTAHLRLQRTPRPLVLDVREPWEYAQGHLPGALLIPLGELEQRLSEVPRDRPIIAVCHLGQRSLEAALFLSQSGFAEVSSLDGGTAAWAEHGLPLEY